MGLMLGNFVDDYTVNCIDVFAMPQSGTSVTVEAVDPVFQHKMLEMLKQTGRCVLRIDRGVGVDRGVCGVAVRKQKLTLTRFLYTTLIGHRPEMVVGWYHSHPGFGCWLSGVDVNTQQVRCSSCFYMKDGLMSRADRPLSHHHHPIPLTQNARASSS